MFTHYNKYREIVILSSSEGSRYVFGIVPARDPSALRFVGMTRDVWVNYYIISNYFITVVITISHRSEKMCF